VTLEVMVVNKLVQRQLFRGTHEYEIVGDQLNVRVKTRFKEESLSILLSVLNPEPVIDRSSVAFVSRVNGEPLVSFQLAKPDAQTFNAFVNHLKQQALAEYNAFSGLRTGEPVAGPGGNSFDEPPDFGDPDELVVPTHREIRVDEVETAIRMLKTHLPPGECADLIEALEGLRDSPEDQTRLGRVVEVFSGLGGHQGAVLTYAPYLAFLLSDDPWG
jgi:hypothetical protein